MSGNSKIGQTKILHRDELRLRVEEWRRARERVTLANGNFDLLHVGHVRYLRAAKALGGKLVVAINSDESVRSLKAVVVFTELDVRAIIREIHPDVQAKGTDYTVDSVPERDAVVEYGGRVEIVGDPKNHSTSEIIRSRLSKRLSKNDRGQKSS